MPYIPQTHQQYGLLPLCRLKDREVFVYPSKLLNQLNSLLSPDDHLDPYGYRSYEEYDQEIDRLAESFSDQPEVIALFETYKNRIHEMNRKEQWSVLRYIGPDDGQILGLTHNRCYYWPCTAATPVYSGVVDDEEYTSYLYPIDNRFWEIVEDPTGMARNTIHGAGKRNAVREDAR